ncbi:unnamed protein product [Paramecium sonneborni]|uniref:Uncharacterized protein n=1 Tax=Paramecium sonneborni TaxID=65129 RepID=A0A8S1MCM2_9CILI|nr:unnamed protein product [Paramecium sonneborni]
MRSPSLFSPSKQQRYEKQNGSFQTFSTTNQVNKVQLADFRKEIRNNISQREPFIPQQDKKPILLTSWKKHERKNTEGNVAKYMARSSPKKSLPGGLNMEEILRNLLIRITHKIMFIINKGKWINYLKWIKMILSINKKTHFLIYLNQKDNHKHYYQDNQEEINLQQIQKDLEVGIQNQIFSQSNQIILKTLTITNILNNLKKRIFMKQVNQFKLKISLIQTKMLTILINLQRILHHLNLLKKYL